VLKNHTTLGTNNLYSTGITIRESKVEKIRPPADQQEKSKIYKDWED